MVSQETGGSNGGCGAAGAPRPAPRDRQTVLWVIALLLAVIATALVVRREGPGWAPLAFADTPMAGARGIFAFTGQIDRDRYGLFMMDVDSRNVWCYEYLPTTTRKVRLVFARSFDYDRYLEDYNNDKDTNPQMIRLLLEDQRRNRQRNERGGAGPEESEESLGITVPGVPGQVEPGPPPKSGGQ
jgi:hypothetical protein